MRTGKIGNEQPLECFAIADLFSFLRYMMRLSSFRMSDISYLMLCWLFS